MIEISTFASSSIARISQLGYLAMMVSDSSHGLNDRQIDSFAVPKPTTHSEGVELSTLSVTCTKASLPLNNSFMVLGLGSFVPRESR